MIFSLKKASALVLSLSLIGCANVSSLPTDASAADHLGRAYERSFSVDNRYNFEVEGKLTAVSLIDTQDAPAAEARDDVIIDIDIDIEDAYDVAIIDEMIAAEQNDYSDDAYEQRRLKRKVNMLNTMKNFNFVASGAIDLPNGRMEMTPSIQYYGNNIEAKASLPMALNLSKGELLGDPSAITSTFGWAMGLSDYGIEDANGRFLRYQFDKALIKDFPVKAFAQAYLDAMKKGLAEIKPEQLKFVPVDAFGKKLGASQQIRMDQTVPEMMAFSVSTLTHFKTNIDAFLETYDGQPLPPVLLKFLDELEDMPDMMSMLMDMDEDDKGQITTQYYLSNGDRLLGMYLDMALQEEDLKFNIGTSMKLSNFGRPVWQVTPSEDNIYDIDPALFD